MGQKRASALHKVCPLPAIEDIVLSKLLIARMSAISAFLPSRTGEQIEIGGSSLMSANCTERRSGLAKVSTG